MKVEQQNRSGLAADELRRARSLFPFSSEGRIYLNHAGTSPLSTRVVEAMVNYLRERSVGRLENYPIDMQMVAECRALVQQLIHAESPDRIAFFGSTTDAINVVAGGIPWRTGDRVLSNTVEFPANVYPYLNLKQRGVELDFLADRNGTVTPDMVRDALTPRTKLVALSAVQYLSGYRADLAAIGSLCRARGIIFAVDGIQAVGAYPIDVQQMNIDALAAGAQKWQMSPHGSGFLYITEKLQSQVQQHSLGWLSVEDPWDFHNYSQPIAASARRYEGGSLNIPSLWGMRAALATLLEFGMAAIGEQIRSLTEILTTQLQEVEALHLYSPTNPHERAGIVTVDLAPGVDQKAIVKAMLERNITIALRKGRLRFSPHFYNSSEEMTTAVSVLREYLSATLH